MSLCTYVEQKFNQPDLAYLALRVVFGGTIILFGVYKLLAGGDMYAQIGGSMDMFCITWEPKLWGLLCALTETFGGLFILLGVFTRSAALLLVFNMFVASIVLYKMTGAPDTSSMGAFCEWLGKVSLPEFYLAAFLALLFTGAGKYAIHKKGGGGGGRSKAKE